MTSIILPYLVAISASGKDSHDFLQAQLTADLSRLGDGQAGFAAYCDPKGNVIALLRVIRRGDECLMIAARDLAQPLIATLRKYVLRAEVRFATAEAPVAGVVQDGRLDYVLDPGSAPADANAVSDWRARELSAGIVWLGPETTGRYLPQMLGFDRLGAVSFRKGCFPGQEVIARVRYLGQVKRLPMIAELAGSPGLAPGDEVSLTGKDGPSGTAVVIDSAASGGHTTCFLVARNPEKRPVSAIETGGKRIALKQPDQAWATM